MQSIEVGQVWETREGGRVTIQAIDHQLKRPVIGSMVAVGRGLKQPDRWNLNGMYYLEESSGKSDYDLVRLITPAQVDLTEQTIDTFAKIVRNGGKVPDGYKLERNHKSNGPDRGWLCIDEKGEWSNLLNYRLTPIPQPPRFSVSTDPIGVLDSQQPGMIAKFAGGPDACSHIAGMLNRGERHVDKYEWTPISPEMVPLKMADVPPGSHFKIDGNYVIRPHGRINTSFIEILSDDGFESVTFGELKQRKGMILRPGQTEWQRCEKPKP